MSSSSRLLRSPSALILAVAIGLVASACAGQRPSVQVLGVSPPRQAPAAPSEQVLLVFIEVVNPTNRDLELSRLEYRLQAQSWFETAGKITLERAVAAGSSAVVEIEVPVRGASKVEDGVPYSLEGRLFAHENHVERSWQVQVEGAFVRDRSAAGATRLYVADADAR